MREAPVWKDEFSQVARPLPTQQKVDPRFGYGTLFSINLKELKGDGFARWLTDSFCGPHAYPRAGNFHFGSHPGEGNQWFYEVFYGAAQYFDEETVGFAREGMTKAIAGVDENVMTYNGALELTECSAILGMKDEFERMIPLLLRKEEEVLAEQAAKAQTSAPAPITP